MKHARYISFGLLALGFIVLGSDAVVLAQDAAASPAAAAAGGGGGSMSLLDFLKYGGLIGAIILLGSVAARGISIERAIGLKRDNIVPPDIFL